MLDILASYHCMQFQGKLMNQTPENGKKPFLGPNFGSFSPNLDPKYFFIVIAPSCYLELFDKLQKRICRTIGPSLAASLEPLAHCQNVASLSLFIGITLVDVHLNCLNWFHFLILVGGLLVILIDCMIFLSPFLDVTRCLCQQFLSWHS